MSLPNPQFNISPVLDSNVQELFRAYSNIFQESFIHVPDPVVPKLCMEVTSDGTSTVFYFLQQVYPARLWMGSRVLRNIAATGIRFNHLRYELTNALDKTAVLGDKNGVLNNTMRLTGLSAGRWLEVALALQIKCGEGNYVAAGGEDPDAVKIYNANATGALTLGGAGYWDTANFFSTSHPIDPLGAIPGVQSNLLDSTADLTESTLAAAIEAGQALLGPDGLSAGLYMNKVLLVVPPALAMKAKRLTSTEFFGDELSSATAGSVSNFFRGMVEVVVMPYLSNKTNEWYLVDASGVGSPFAAVTASREMVVITDPTNPDVFYRDSYVFGARMSGGISLANASMIIKCRPA